MSNLRARRKRHLMRAVLGEQPGSTIQTRGVRARKTPRSPAARVVGPRRPGKNATD
ncbi:MAG TPA: hypothetical protein VIJ70_04180 [Gaiellaceae bacterium]